MKVSTDFFDQILHTKSTRSGHKNIFTDETGAPQFVQQIPGKKKNTFVWQYGEYVYVVNSRNRNMHQLKCRYEKRGCKVENGKTFLHFGKRFVISRTRLGHGALLPRDKRIRVEQEESDPHLRHLRFHAEDSGEFWRKLYFKST